MKIGYRLVGPGCLFANHFQIAVDFSKAVLYGVKACFHRAKAVLYGIKACFHRAEAVLYGINSSIHGIKTLIHLGLETGDRHYEDLKLIAFHSTSLSRWEKFVECGCG